MNQSNKSQNNIKTLNDLAKFADYSLMQNLNRDPDATSDGEDYHPRQVFTGHYVPVKPTAIENPQYITHSKTLFSKLGFSDSLAKTDEFMKMFSGDISEVPEPLSKFGWATGYALSIFGTEYYAQCPFGTGNGYGDGRAVSIFEGVLNGKRWEMQLKGGGRTPYCRGADGRAVLRSSVREFVAQEHMHALGVPTSRSLSLFTSSSQTVQRPWYSDGSYAQDPDMMVSEAVAISTRVAPSFLRVGQVELFARRARKNEHEHAKEELEKIVLHLIDREYSDEIDKSLPIEEKVVILALEFRDRLTSLVADWIRVGYCQGNFNSDNCAAGGFALDYGPFGFIELFDALYQPWTGGGYHFSFLNQTEAAEKNFHVFYTSLLQLVKSSKIHSDILNKIREDFSSVMEEKMKVMWAKKLGLETFNAKLFDGLEKLMSQTSIDYTLFFRELSNLPEDIESLEKSVYTDGRYTEVLKKRWEEWLEQWNLLINKKTKEQKENLSKQMKLVNPKYTLREWFLVPAYEGAKEGNYTILNELLEVMNDPYSEQSQKVAEKYYKLKPIEFFKRGGISHLSCSS